MNFLLVGIILWLSNGLLVQAQIADVVIKEECGGMEYQDSGSITHRLNENYRPNQICTWVIQTNNASKVSQIRIKLVEDGFSSSTSLAIYSPTENGDLMTTKSFIRGDRNEYEFTGLAFIVVYKSGRNNQTEKGFKLSYSTINEYSLETETRLITSFVLSQFNYSNWDVTSFKYPPNGNFYEPNQLFVLVLQPPTLIFPVQKNEFTNIYLHVYANGIEPNCNHDKLSLYTIQDHNYPFPYYEGRWCDGTNLRTYNGNNALIILTFKSDSRVNHLGFTYTHCFVPPSS